MKLYPVTLFFLLFSVIAEAQETDGFVPLTDRGIFSTPMTVVNHEEVQIIRNRIENGIEPQASAYLSLLADADAALNFTSQPPDNMHIMGGYEENSNLNEMRALMDRESNAAYSTALAWLYSGEDKYAEKSAEILRAWYEKWTGFGGNDAGLQIGSWFNRMLYAADIMKGYEGWTVTDRRGFRRWWYKEALPHTITVMLLMDNNWQDAAVLGVLTAGVVFEDLRVLNLGLKALDEYFLARQGNADWKFANDDNGVYIPREVTRIEGLRGITYTAYALTTMVQALEIARYCGYDWWHREAENGATIKEAINYYFLWNEKGKEFPWNSEALRLPVDGHRKNPYELANNIFPGEIRGLSEWLEKHRPVNGRQGDTYITLNKGDMQ